MITTPPTSPIQWQSVDIFIQNVPTSIGNLSINFYHTSSGLLSILKMNIDRQIKSQFYTVENFILSVFKMISMKSTFFLSPNFQVLTK